MPNVSQGGEANIYVSKWIIGIVLTAFFGVSLGWAFDLIRGSGVSAATESALNDTVKEHSQRLEVLERNQVLVAGDIGGIKRGVEDIQNMLRGRK